MVLLGITYQLVFPAFSCSTSTAWEGSPAHREDQSSTCASAPDTDTTLLTTSQIWRINCCWTENRMYVFGAPRITAWEEQWMLLGGHGESLTVMGKMKSELRSVCIKKFQLKTKACCRFAEELLVTWSCVLPKSQVCGYILEDAEEESNFVLIRSAQ